MQTINIQAIPNQEFTINIGDYRYDIRLIFIQPGVMAYDLLIDEAPVIEGQRIVPGEMLMPYEYQEVDGNFYLSIPEDEEPDYEQFSDSQRLYYLTADESAQVRANGD